MVLDSVINVTMLEVFLKPIDLLSFHTVRKLAFNGFTLDGSLVGLIVFSAPKSVVCEEEGHEEVT